MRLYYLIILSLLTGCIKSDEFQRLSPEPIRNQSYYNISCNKDYTHCYVTFNMGKQLKVVSVACDGNLQNCMVLKND